MSARLNWRWNVWHLSMCVCMCECVHYTHNNNFYFPAWFCFVLFFYCVSKRNKQPNIIPINMCVENESKSPDVIWLLNLANTYIYDFGFCFVSIFFLSFSQIIFPQFLLLGQCQMESRDSDTTGCVSSQLAYFCQFVYSPSIGNAQIREFPFILISFINQGDIVCIDVVSINRFRANVENSNCVSCDSSLRSSICVLVNTSQIC